MSITQGQEDLESIRRGLMKMDVRRKGSTKKQKVYAVDGDSEEDEQDVTYLELEEDLIMDDEDVMSFYEAISAQ
eukprot:1693595-Pyramimonas_sp.AAC.1